MEKTSANPKLALAYTLLCDDVRLEMGNKISMMGVFQNVMVEQLPVSLIKFAVVNHWKGEGMHQTEVRILSPRRDEVIVTSQPTAIDLGTGGFTDNVSFFVNVVFQVPGNYWVQTIADKEVVEEFPLIVTDVNSVEKGQGMDQVSETIN